MEGLRRTLLLVSLLVVLEGMAAAAGGHPGRSLPGAPHNISKDDRGLRRAVLTATHSFNNQSNDAFLFRASAINTAQRQIIKGIRYIMQVQISRTICRKRDNSPDLSKCGFQPDGALRQTLSCHFEVWAMPWLHQMKTLFFFCRS
ncbi:cystatin [Myripristis murdjan]|uniref:Cystatin F n=1 Tax=Myripristis murdjan TaxID=586833 RepID=A0A668A5A5_9TELE|nr:cystatin-F [Myripristis murdjan]